MVVQSESEVGSKEELYPPKSIRRALGLRPGMKIRFRVEGRRLVVEPILTVRELIEMGAEASTSLAELRDERRELSRRLEEGRRKRP